MSRDDLTELVKEMVEMLDASSKTIDALELSVGSQDKIIKEQRTELAKLNKELVEQTELVDSYQRDEQQWKKDKQCLQADVERLRTKVTEFKGDANNSRSLIKECEEVAPKIGDMLDRLRDLQVLLGPEKVENDSEQVLLGPEPDTSRNPVVKGVFICCGNSKYKHENLQRKFPNLKEMLPMIDFGSGPIFVLKDSERPPLPQEGIELIIIFAAGLSHGDTEHYRGIANGAHVFSHNYSLTSLVQKVDQWLANKFPIPVS